jgi:hypothetical protein
MKNGVFWGVTPCGSCKNRDVSEELSASFTRVTRIGELGTTLRRVATEPRSVRRLPHGVTSKKTTFFIYGSWSPISQT